MNNVAFLFSDTFIYWSGIIVTLGIASCLCISLALYKMDKDNRTAGMFAFFIVAFVLGGLIGRFFHWYTHIEQYRINGLNLIGALKDYSFGSFCIPGVLIGVMLAALIVGASGLAKGGNRLLDASAPGLAMLIALIRLSAVFTDSCRTKIPIEKSAFQRLPFAVPAVDSAGGESYRLAIFFIEFLIMLVLFFFIIRFYCLHRNDKMIGMKRSGNVFKLFLVFYGAVEIVCDSTRNDSPLMHFNLLKMLNPYASFISVVQLFAAISILVVFIYYLSGSIRARGWKWYHVGAIALFAICLFGVGYLGEYKVQRTGMYVRCYTIQALSVLIIAILIFLIYRSCKKKKRVKTA